MFYGKWIFHPDVLGNISRFQIIIITEVCLIQPHLVIPFLIRSKIQLQKCQGCLLQREVAAFSSNERKSRRAALIYMLLMLSSDH